MVRSTPLLASVVTPFHNTEQYLAECIESVLAQSYDHWEYVLVDNQSTDRSRAIAEDYAQRDPRIRLLHTDRLLTQVENYNFALRQIAPSSTYCKVVQADDWIFPDCLKAMIETAEISPAIGIVASYRLRGTDVIGEGLPYSTRAISGSEVCRKVLLEGLFIFGSPTTVLFRSDVIRGRVPFYAEHRLHEDTEACFEILKDRDFGFVHQVLTFTRTDNESITSATRSYRPRLLDQLIVIKAHGRHYLSEQEYRVRTADLEKAYYRRLGSSLVRGQGAEFWAYHRAGLATIGERLSLVRVIWYATVEIVELLFNPLSTIQRVWRHIRHPARQT